MSCGSPGKDQPTRAESIEYGRASSTGARLIAKIYGVDPWGGSRFVRNGESPLIYPRCGNSMRVLLSSVWSSLLFAAPERFSVISLTAVDRFRRYHYMDELMGNDISADFQGEGISAARKSKRVIF